MSGRPVIGLLALAVLTSLCLGNAPTSNATDWCSGGVCQEWVASYGPSEANFASALAVDNIGNVFVTGNSLSPGSDPDQHAYDYATVKYDNDGNQTWAARYDGPAGGEDVPTALAVDASGNAYVTGRSDALGTAYDYATIKYDSGGNQVWVARYDGPGHIYDKASDITVDNAGNVYVTG
jgi:hypothetical protein